MPREPAGAGRPAPGLPSLEAAPPAPAAAPPPAGGAGAGEGGGGGRNPPAGGGRAGGGRQLGGPPRASPPLPGRFPDPRSPDEARATVSAIQHGSERGRSVFDPAPGQPPELG